MGKKILILGVTGMLGHTLFTELSKSEDNDVYATARSLNGLSKYFLGELLKKIRTDVDAYNLDTVIRALASIQPDIVINCIGLIKQLPLANDPLNAITINAQFPHRLSLACCAAGARMIHISTDCVFDGKKGHYIENDIANATDLYGKTKFLGEVQYPHCVTIRTSIIGHELKGSYGLIDWFLNQKGKIRGFTKAIYTGFPTIEMARIIDEYVIPNSELSGLYQVSSEPISKYHLLKLVAQIYEKDIEIEPFDDFYSDRSLDSSKFRNITGYNPPSWVELIDKMHQNFMTSPYNRMLQGDK
jgi:dTDP-4-dehydrorhamnose reductase